MKKEILEKIKNTKNNTEERTAITDGYWVVGECFTDKELEDMNEECLERLIKLGIFSSEAFY